MLNQKFMLWFIFAICCFVAGIVQTKQTEKIHKLQVMIYENEFVDYVKVPINNNGDFRIVYSKDEEFIKQVRKGRQIFRENIY